MVNGLKLVLLSIVLLFFSCEVKFDETLREYIDDVAARTPLRFTVDGGQDVQGEQSFIMGYHITDYTQVCTIINNENRDITLNGFEGISGDINISPIASLVLGVGETFSFPITYIPTINPGKTITDKVTFKDSDGRKFVFRVLATSRRQPIKLFNLDGAAITTFDMGNWLHDERRVVIKNVGLEEIEIHHIGHPAEIELMAQLPIHMNIFDEVEVTFIYRNDAIHVFGLNNAIIDYNNHSLENNYQFEIIAGGPLNLEFGQAAVPLGSYTAFSAAVGSNHIEEFYIKNLSTENMDITASIVNSNNSNYFLTDLGSRSLIPNEISLFNVNFVPGATGASWWIDLMVRDQVSNRDIIIYFQGSAP